MRKLFVFLVAIFLAANAYAYSWTDTGTQNIETVYVTDMGNLISGDVVILQTTAPTYPGREVTGTTTKGMKIHGVVLGDPDAVGCANGTWVRIQTFGYCPVVKMSSEGAVTLNTSHLVTSGQMFKATSHQECNQAGTGGAYFGVTGNSIALETKSGVATQNHTIKAWLSN